MGHCILNSSMVSLGSRCPRTCRCLSFGMIDSSASTSNVLPSANPLKLEFDQILSDWASETTSLPPWESLGGFLSTPSRSSGVSDWRTSGWRPGHWRSRRRSRNRPTSNDADSASPASSRTLHVPLDVLRVRTHELEGRQFRKGAGPGQGRAGERRKGADQVAVAGGPSETPEWDQYWNKDLVPKPGCRRLLGHPGTRLV